MAWALIQEGGASIELYLHVHETLEDAEADRRDCAAGGAYRTTEPVEVPDSLNETAWSAFDSLLESLATLDLADYDENDYDEDGEFIERDDGVSGQDRESYADEQDRESYADEQKEES